MPGRSGTEPTDTEKLELPEWLRAAVLRSRRNTAVLQQEIPVNTAWWSSTLAKYGAEIEMFETDEQSLTRSDLFALGQSATTPEGALRLLWASLAWGTGRSNRNNAARVALVMDAHHHVGALLAEAAHISRTDPAQAYELLRPGQNAVPRLGPPFFTKFLYFAGGGDPEHPCLILDSRVAESLRRACGWSSLRRGPTYVWPSSTYKRYCQLLRRWAAELSETVPVAPDQFERALFDGP